jgi:MFS family permease
MAGTATESAAPPALRRDPAFRRFWLARVCSLAGTSVTWVAMPVLVYQLTGSSLWTALVTVAEATPYLAVGLVAGLVADRVDRRRLMVASDLGNAALLASVPLAHAAGALTAAQVLVVALCSQTLFVFFDAANVGALPALVGRDRIAAAQSAVYGATFAIELVLPMLAGVALVAVPAADLLAFDAVMFVASALLIRAILRPFAEAGGERETAERVLAGLRAGVAFVWRNVHVRTLTFVGFVQCLAGGMFVAQLVPWADQTLSVAPDDGRIGLLFAAWGVGGITASALFGRIAASLGEARATLVFLPLSAAGGVLVAVSAHWLVAMACIAGWGIAYMVVAIAQITMRQKASPDRLQGRVHTAARVLSWGIGWPGGAVLGGAIGEAAGPRTAMIVAAGVLVLGAAAVCASPALRRPPVPTGA